MFFLFRFRHGTFVSSGLIDKGFKLVDDHSSNFMHSKAGDKEQADPEQDDHGIHINRFLFQDKNPGQLHRNSSREHKRYSDNNMLRIVIYRFKHKIFSVK